MILGQTPSVRSIAIQLGIVLLNAVIDLVILQDHVKIRLKLGGLFKHSFAKYLFLLHVCEVGTWGPDLRWNGLILFSVWFAVSGKVLERISAATSLSFCSCKSWVDRLRNKFTFLSVVCFVLLLLIICLCVLERAHLLVS